MTLEETLQKIHPLDEEAMEISRKRWDSIAKPLHSLGKMEDLVVQIAGITGSPDMNLKKRALVAMCADNGVVEEGVTQTGQEVTAIVAENFLTGDTSACTMCRQCGTDVYPVDVGMAVDTKVPTDLKVGSRRGSRWFPDSKRKDMDSLLPERWGSEILRPVVLLHLFFLTVRWRR